MTHENSQQSPEMAMVLQIVQEVCDAHFQEWMSILESHKASEIIACVDKVYNVLPPEIAERQLVLVSALASALYAVRHPQPVEAKMPLRYLQRGMLAAAMNMLMRLSRAIEEKADEGLVHVHAQPERPQ